MGCKIERERGIWMGSRIRGFEIPVTESLEFMPHVVLVPFLPGFGMHSGGMAEAFR